MALRDDARFYPPAPAPERIAHSHWMAHLPFAFWIMDVQRPSVLVELGAYTGVSFCAFCQAARISGVECNAYAVDLWKGDANMGPYGEDVYEDLRAYVESHYASFAYLIRSSFDDALGLFRDGTVDLLHLDGYHTCEAIEHDFDAWLPKMSTRGVVLIHDVCARIPGYGGVEAWAKISERFPSFSFRHGYGLGVVVTGANPPKTLLELTEAPESEIEDIRGIFHSQGKIYEWIFSREQELVAEKARQREEVARLRADCEKMALDLGRELDKEREKHRENVKKLGAMLAGMKSDYSSQMAELNEKLAQQYHEYHDSLSWRLTAPLRKIGGKFRS